MLDACEDCDYDDLTTSYVDDYCNNGVNERSKQIRISQGKNYFSLNLFVTRTLGNYRLKLSLRFKQIISSREN